jgi:hypothetical protein
MSHYCHYRKQSEPGILPERFRTSRNDSFTGDKHSLRCEKIYVVTTCVKRYSSNYLYLHLFLTYLLGLLTLWGLRINHPRLLN